MQSKSDVLQGQAQSPEFAESKKPQPLLLLRDTERSLRVKTLESLDPILPHGVAQNLGEFSIIADHSLDQLAKIDLNSITDAELRPARIQMGLIFIGFGALTMAFLLLFLSALYPELSPIEQMHHFWYQYVWFVCLGVAGLFMVGREAMRPGFEPDSQVSRPDR